MFIFEHVQPSTGSADGSFVTDLKELAGASNDGSEEFDGDLLQHPQLLRHSTLPHVDFGEPAQGQWNLCCSFSSGWLPGLRS